jgi:hypothetical protein
MQQQQQQKRYTFKLYKLLLKQGRFSAVYWSRVTWTLELLLNASITMEVQSLPYFIAYGLAEFVSVSCWLVSILWKDLILVEVRNLMFRVY